MVTLTGLLSNLFSGGASCEMDFQPVDLTSSIHNVQNILKENIDINSIDKNVKDWGKNIGLDGSWSSINYIDYGRATWIPYEHLNRIFEMSQAFVNMKSSYYNNKELGRKIVNGLNYWIKKAPYCANWWYNDIAVPQSIGKIMILLEGSGLLDTSLKNALVRLMNRGDLKASTGANKADIALHYLMRGMLTGNENLVESTAQSIFDEVKITSGEGIQIDNSYHQHGSQLYISGYGDVFIESILVIAQYLQGTKYALQEEKLNILSSFVIDGFLPIFRSCYKDYNAGGRLFTRKGALNCQGFVKQLKILERLDKKNKEEYAKAINQIENRIYDVSGEYNKLYWRSDYMIHNRSSYNASVRAASERVDRMETGGNGENLKGTLVSAGSMSVRVSGDEYFNIFPCWNWSAIPGVTSIKNNIPIINKNDWGSQGSGRFIGGVSDGNIGTFVLDYDEFGIKAHKGYFFFENEIVCLGSMISSDINGIVNTAIEQNKLMGEVYILDQGNLVNKFIHGQSSEKLKGILHNRIGYFVNNDSDIEIKIENSVGSWKDINSSASGEKVCEKIFSILVNHGIKPVSEAYAYIIVPNIKTIEDFKTYPIRKIEIIQNCKEVQAVANEVAKELQIIFYNKGKICYKGISISVDSPMTVLVPDYENIQYIYVSDPTQTLDLAKLTLNGNEYNVSFLKDGLAGKSIKVNIK